MSHHRGKRVGKFRSKLEAFVSARLRKMRVKAEYEPDKIPYVVEKEYTPDFKLENGTYLEVKGVLMQNDRNKMIHFKKCNPDVEVIFVFAKPDNKVPGLKSTHAEWAERNGFKWLHATEFKLKDLQS